MAMSNAIKNAFNNLFNLGSREQTKKPVKRVETLQDLAQTSTKEAVFDPATGRRVSAELPASLLTASGHYVLNSDAVLGECVACRDDFADAGEPDRVNVVANAPGSGGICKGCGKVYCVDHGGFDDQGLFWCGGCKFNEGIKKVEGAVVNALLGRRAKS